MLIAAERSRAGWAPSESQTLPEVLCSCRGRHSEGTRKICCEICLVCAIRPAGRLPDLAFPVKGRRSLLHRVTQELFISSPSNVEMGGWASSTLGALARTAMLAGAWCLGFLWWCLQRDQELCQADSLQMLKAFASPGDPAHPTPLGAAGAQQQPEQPRGRHKGKCPQCRSGCMEQVCAVCALSHCSC